MGCRTTVMLVCQRTAMREEAKQTVDPASMAFMIKFTITWRNEHGRELSEGFASKN